MQALLIVLVAIVLLVIGYIFYGNWLCKQWGVDPNRKTPAIEMEDGVDYVAAKPAVLMGHHFSSIAGAGPINGPIQASIFGWVPVFLWCVIGGIFFGGIQDFGSLFASVRNEGKSVGEIIKSSMGRRSQKLFIIFALLVLLLVIASFVNVVAGTFFDANSAVAFGIVTNPSTKQTTAMISVLFIVLAICYGILTNKFGLKTGPATIIGIIGIVVITVIGLKVGLAMTRTAWIVFIAVYITVASLIPVWIMLQPRDYLSSFLLYAMMIVAVAGVIINAFTGRATFQLPAFAGWRLENGQTMFPYLFITVACGACSGFHSLISTGTSSKQLANEKDAKVIGYGSMLIESALGIISLLAVGMVFGAYKEALAAGSAAPAVFFAAGIASMIGAEGSTVYNTVSALLTLAVSVFALTSLDTGTRLSRFMFSELFLKEDEATYKDASGFRAFIAHPLVGTAFMVAVGAILGGMSLSAIWGLFGAANQLLAGIALMAVAAWLGQVGKNNKMFYIPMVFMLAATLSFLVLKIKSLASAAKLVGAFGDVWGNWFQFIFAIAMVVLAVILVIEGISVLFLKKESK